MHFIAIVFTVPALAVAALLVLTAAAATVALVGGDADAGRTVLKMIVTLACDALPEIAIVLLAIYAARIFQHVLDWKKWFTPWARARLNRISEDDFPVFFIGHGGSGKTTLAQIMEHDFINRVWFKPAGFIEVRERESLVARGDSKIGGDITQYRTTWRPEKYQIGYLSRATDLPGQVREDWKWEIQRMAKSGRIGVINVLTYGYSSELTSYRDKDEHGVKPQGSVESLLEKGYIDPCKLDEFIDCYRDSVRKVEIHNFECLAAIMNSISTRRSKPKILIINVVAKADYWIKESETVKTYYEEQFEKAQESLITAFGIDRVRIVTLPIALVFGDLEHKWIKDVKDGRRKQRLYESLPHCNDVPDDRDRRRMIVKERAKLMCMSDATLRTIREEIYRRDWRRSVEWRGEWPMPHQVS
ncbi:MAG: hypothetical protein A3E78_05935 [Alphaproteobacteria bacterium RIFCSPHIGHO2_12_FULL_63_12]|nr:MAG: hypothetical protein A3E78_05935 [Alphaproteobacteria bacterium RIFCSPHIGHO2_12_FULL_63_12]